MSNKKIARISVLKHFENLNQQNNFFIQGEIQGINNLCQTSPEIADRIVKLLENGQKINQNNNDRIIAIEENEQKMRKNRMQFQHRFMTFGMLTFLAMFFVPLSIGIWFIFEGKEESIYFIMISVALISPKVYKDFKTPKNQNPT